jgi:hypothetical protein
VLETSVRGVASLPFKLVRPRLRLDSSRHNTKQLTYHHSSLGKDTLHCKTLYYIQSIASYLPSSARFPAKASFNMLHSNTARGRM